MFMALRSLSRFYFILILSLSYSANSFSEELNIEIGSEQIIELPNLAKAVNLSDASVVSVKKLDSKMRLIFRGLKIGKSTAKVSLTDGNELQYTLIVSSRLARLKEELAQLSGLKFKQSNGKIIVTSGLDQKFNQIRYQELKLEYGQLLNEEPDADASAGTVVNTINRVLRENDLGSFEAHAYGKIVVLEGSAKDKPQAEFAHRIARMIYPEIENRISTDSNGGPAVSIEVLFIEVTKGDEQKMGFGVDGGAKTSQAARSSLANATLHPMTGSARVGAGSIGWQVGALTSFLQLIQSRSTSRVLSNPKLVTRSGSVAKFHAGDTVYLTNKEYKDNSIVTTFVPVDAGILLKITPKLDAIGQIDSSIDTEVSEFGDAKSESVPTIHKSTVSTAVTVKDGQTIMLSGLARRKNLKTVDRVPLLADVPLVGEIFKSRKSIDLEVEMLVLVTMNRIRAFDDKAKAAGYRLWDNAAADVEFRLND